MALNFPANPTVGDTYISGNTTWQFDGVAWSVVESATPFDVPNSFNNILISGQDTLTANATNDSLTLVAGSNITLTTDTGADSITIASTATGGGGGETQNLWETIAGDTGSLIAQTPNDTITFVGGTNIGTSVANDEVTINFTGTTGSDTFSGLTDATTAGLDVSRFYMPAIAMLTVDNNGASSFTFNSHYSGDNPTVYAIAGTTIAFNLNAIGGHPFEIQAPTSNPYSTGLVHVAPDGTVSTDTDAQGKDEGVLYWQIPEIISGTYRYQCQNHIAMVGGINIRRISVI
jgi:plastocyanin